MTLTYLWKGLWKVRLRLRYQRLASCWFGYIHKQSYILYMIAVDI